MQAIYTGESAPHTLTKSLFLAGPSPRTEQDLNWRPEALKILKKLGYDGVVYLPVWKEGLPKGKVDYDSQVNWETEYLKQADVIVFWVPRDLKTAPAFTTNSEFGIYMRSGRCVLGYPKEAEKMKYLDWWAQEEGIPIENTLEGALKVAVERLGKGAERTGAERTIPLLIWQREDFQSWYRNLKEAGNRLDGVDVEWAFRVGKKKERLFLYTLHVNVWIEKEGRAKTNEIVLFRPDISCIVAYRKGATLQETEVVLVREFRSPVSNREGYVYEFPGGSSVKPGGDPLTVASEELHEETGVEIEASRFRTIGERQLAATLCAHKAHVFAVELTEDEMLRFRWAALEAHGNHEDTEYTYIEIKTVAEILQDNLVDWTNVGILFRTLTQGA